MFQDGSQGPPTYSPQRCKPCQRGHSLYEPAPIPAAARARHGVLQQASPPKLHPRPRSGNSGSWRERTEKCSRRPGQPWRRVLADPKHPGHPAISLNLRPQLREQFHVLLNSLFKVLFNFPSRYLFAIGLGVIFSLTWSLPRTLSCTPKQLDSREKPAQQANGFTGLSPSAGRGPSQGVLELVGSLREGSPKHHMPRDREGRRFGAGLCPFHSPLLGASQLFSFPPLINMLKFGG